MRSTISSAVLPKVRGLYGKRLTTAEYEELLRRRTVPEVAAALRGHPYFKESLATLSLAEPHRGQIEELLQRDVYSKYKSLSYYDTSVNGFSGFYHTEVEIQQLLRAIHFLSIGLDGVYLEQLPSYLVDELRIDLFALAHATTMEQILEVVAHTPYHTPLANAYNDDPNLDYFALLESAMLRFLYDHIFTLIDANLGGNEHQAVQDLFLLAAEVYNLELLFRIKTYFPHVYTPPQIEQLVLPYRYRLTKRLWQPMLDATGGEALLALYRPLDIFKAAPVLTVDTLIIEGDKALQKYARHLLQQSASPAAVMSAFLTLAQMEVSNVINVIEGVRYQLPPQQIRSMLRL